MTSTRRRNVFNIEEPEEEEEEADDDELEEEPVEESGEHVEAGVRVEERVGVLRDDDDELDELHGRQHDPGGALGVREVQVHEEVDEAVDEAVRAHGPVVEDGGHGEGGHVVEPVEEQQGLLGVLVDEEQAVAPLPDLAHRVHHVHGAVQAHAGARPARAFLPRVEAPLVVGVQRHHDAHAQRHQAQQDVVPVAHRVDRLGLQQALEPAPRSEPVHEPRVRHHHQDVAQFALWSAQVVAPRVVGEQPANVVLPPT